MKGLDWDRVRREFRDKARAAKSESALYETINDMLGRLEDFHTWAVPPSSVDLAKMGLRVGTGLVTERVNDGLIVRRIVPDSPADRVGIRAGWTLLKINGLSVASIRAARTIARKGDRVKLAFRTPDADERVFDLAYDEFPMQPERVGKPFPSGAYYLGFSGFDDETGKWFVQLVEEHRNAPALIVDLRFNNGGRIAVLRSCLDTLFPARRTLAYFVDRAGKSSALECSGRGDASYPGKVIVLVNSQSRSAAEMFAAIVRETGRGTVIGARTAGAVLNSFEVELPDGGRLNISRRDFRMPTGHRLEGTGVAPDKEVGVGAADVLVGRDPELDAALQEVECAPSGILAAPGSS